MKDTAALILAGGDARRLGGVDKALIQLGGHSILSRIQSRLRPTHERIALSANGDPARFGGWAGPVLTDDRNGIGPLAGLLRGLDWAAAQGAVQLLTVPGDTPFIPDRLAERLAPAPAVATFAGRRHHLVALWPVDSRHRLRTYLDELPPDAPRRAYGVVAFAQTIAMREVAFDEFAADPFFNVNTPEDQATAEARSADKA